MAPFSVWEHLKFPPLPKSGRYGGVGSIPKFCMQPIQISATSVCPTAKSYTRRWDQFPPVSYCFGIRFIVHALQTPIIQLLQDSDGQARL